MRANRVFFLFVSFCLTACQGFVTREGLKEQEQKREITDRVTTLQRSNADVNNRFADIESDLRQLNGKVEVMENRVGVSHQANEKSRRASEDQLVEMQKKMAILQEEIAKLQDQVSGLANEMVATKSAAAVERTETKSGIEAGEEFFEKKEWRKAILNYQKFREARPKDKRVPEAIYKIGVSFQELGMKDEAKTFYDEVASKYPNSTEAKKAKIRLKKLK